MVYLNSQGVANPNYLPTSIPRLLNLIEASENGSRDQSFAFAGGRSKTHICMWKTAKRTKTVTSPKGEQCRV